MDDDYDPNVSGGGSRGSTSLPKFNHLYPILFFSHFIRFCGANKCGGPLSSPDGRIESIVTLEGDTGLTGEILSCLGVSWALRDCMFVCLHLVLARGVRALAIVSGVRVEPCCTCAYLLVHHLA